MYVTVKNDTAIIKVDGEIINTTIKQIKAELDSAYQAGCTKVCFDLLKTTDIESAGITGMFQIRNKVGPENFSCRNLNQEITELFIATALNSWIDNRSN